MSCKRKILQSIIISTWRSLALAHFLWRTCWKTNFYQVPSVFTPLHIYITYIVFGSTGPAGNESVEIEEKTPRLTIDSSLHYLHVFVLVFSPRLSFLTCIWNYTHMLTHSFQNFYIPFIKSSLILPSHILFSVWNKTHKWEQPGTLFGILVLLN